MSRERPKEAPKRHFSFAECACRCGCGKTVRPALLDALERLRKEAGGHPILVHSGARCEQRNAGVGGTKGSQHLRGIAADVSCPEALLKDLYLAAQRVEEFEKGGIGLLPGAKPPTLHVDVRGKRARWGMVEGRYVPIEVAELELGI